MIVTLISIHGLMRWLIAIVAVAAIVKFALGWQGKAAFTSADRGLMSAYAGLLDLNFLLGLLILIFGGGFTTRRIEHAVTMLIAIALVHGSAKWRKSGGNKTKFRNSLIVLLLSLLFIFMGVVRVRGGWL